ncbi:hypothetical protein HGRIS_008720 [Hohenbuehelia grisea]|uniref:Uncharacterized protein n=1 Tax=Hohenbuehelia grisea TaxID=104357 RepID=A0ABR3J8W5_9AGAR
MSAARPILKHFPRYSESRRPPALCLAPSPQRHAGHSPSRVTSFASSSTSSWPISPSGSPFPFASSAMNSPHVHFPPTPSMASTHTTHSPNTYDRAPIVVSPNICSLPERGGRVYHPPGSPGYMPRRRTMAKGSYFHPAAFEACERETLDDGSPLPTSPLSPPPLVADLTSESDSDGYASPDAVSPPAPSHIASDPRFAPMLGPHSGGPYPPSPYPLPLPRTHSQEEFETALEFLPHSGVESKRLRDKERESRSRRNRRAHQASTFSGSSLDGCLGGF